MAIHIRRQEVVVTLGGLAAMFKSIFNGALATLIGYDPPPRSCCNWRRM
jgi:hypothetical protein